MQAVASLNPTQVQLLRMFSFNQTEASMKSLKQTLFAFYCQQVERKGAELAQSMHLSDADLEAMSYEHNRI